MSDEDYVRVRVSERPGWYSVERDGRNKVVPVDAIVIERSNLPVVVTETQAWALVRSVTGYPNALEAAERQALAALAAIEYLRANPPVDETQVAAVRAALTDSGLSVSAEACNDLGNFEAAIMEAARRLVARGVRVEVEK